MESSLSTRFLVRAYLSDVCVQSRMMGVCESAHAWFGVYPFFNLLDRLSLIVGPEFCRSRLERTQLTFLLPVEVLVGYGEWMGNWMVWQEWQHYGGSLR